jgi:hypothetical protein
VGKQTEESVVPNYQAITKGAFAPLRWKRFESYRFAAQDAVAPLVAQELAKACASLPIAFIKQNEGIIPAAVQGLQPDQNLLVAPDGRWLGPYTPALYRGYPFRLAETEQAQLVLCVDTDSGLVGEHYDQPFFGDAGEPASAINEVLSFLQQVHHNHQLTRRLCAALDAEGLIVPWPVKVKGKDGTEQTIEGLYRIDEAKFNALDADALYRIHQAGALPVVYCQLISMQHIQLLGQLAQASAQRQQNSAPVDIEEVFGSGDDILKFDF